MGGEISCLLSEKQMRLGMRVRRIALPLLQKIYNIVFIRLFPLWQRMGFSIIRNHFYQPIPVVRMLKNELWLRESELVGVNINDQVQVELLREFSSRFKDEYETFPKNKAQKPYQYYINNGSFESVDCEILHCMIRHHSPKKMIEIGAGFSTYLAAQAILRNEEETGHRGRLITIDPYPNEVLRTGFPGLSQLICEKVEDIDLSEFVELKEDDILFIDSSHVLKIGNDVQYEYLEILPRLNRGVIVHFHDIFIPREYPKNWVLESYRFWSEQYLLQAFLAFNSAYEVLWAGSYMHLKHPEKLEEAFNSYDRRAGVGPGSFWIRKKV